MALYFGSDKVKINLDGIMCCLNLNFDSNDAVIARLLSLDGYILKDLEGTYLIPYDYVALNLEKETNNYG